MNYKKISLMLALVLGLWNSNATPVTYTFVPDSTDFSSFKFGGFITLNALSNDSGSLADILAITVSGPFTGSDSIFTVQYKASIEHLVLNSPLFSWTSTAITSMNISAVPNDNPFNLFSVYDYGLSGGGLNVPAKGSWVAVTSTVPDGINTGLLLLLPMIFLAGLRQSMVQLMPARSH